MEELKAGIPNCLTEFRVLDIDTPDPSFDGKEYFHKSIQCKCGCDSFKVLGFKFTETKGLIFNKKQTIDIPPLILTCKDCSQQKLLFNPENHGYYGENGFNTCLVGTGNSVELKSDFGEIVVTYTFQGLENYEEMHSDGVEHLYNYFDTFCVFFKISTKIECLVDCECA